MPVGTKATDDDDDRHTSPTALSTPSQSSLSLDNELQQLAGIRTQRLSQSDSLPEYQAFGTAIPLDGLLSLRQQYLYNLTQQQSAHAKNTEAQLNLTRTRQLHEQDIVSNRRLQEQQAQATNEHAALDASHYQQAILLNNCRMEWGETLCQWFTDPQAKQLNSFLNQTTQLIQITLPPGKQLAPQVKDIMIDNNGKRETAIAATLIANAPRIDPITQGLRYFFKSSNRAMAYGSHLTAWIIDTTIQPSGVSLPRSAVVRYNGESYVFIKTATTEFSRHALTDLVANQTCCFSSMQLDAGDEIVISGAQTLLSQQLNHRIPEEDDD